MKEILHPLLERLKFKSEIISVISCSDVSVPDKNGNVANLKYFFLK